MQCPSCRTKLRQGAQYCRNCGKMIPYNVSNERERQRELSAVASLPRPPVPREAISNGLWPNGVEQQPPSSTSESEPVQAPLPSPVAPTPLPMASQSSTTQLLKKLISMLPSKTSKTTESTLPSLSRWKANLLLYSLTLVVVAFLAGSVLNGLGLFPSTIAAATGALGGMLAAILGVLGGLLAGSIFKEGFRDTWLKANRCLAMLAGILTIAVLLMALFLNTDPYTHRGMLALNDPLQNNSRGYNWVENFHCKFIDGAYHVTVDKEGGYYCSADATNFANFVYQVEITVVKGDCGEVQFRVNRGLLTKYGFEVCPQTGYYHVWRYDPPDKLEYGQFTGNLVKLAGSSAPNAIHLGLKQSNLLTVVANDSSFSFYINQQHVASVSDSAYKQGVIAVEAYDTSQPTDVAFRHAKVWVI